MNEKKVREALFADTQDLPTRTVRRFGRMIS